jgi:Mg2+/Co2+ transporter CorC
LFGRLPSEGEEIEADEHTRLKVDRMRGRRIMAVRVFSNGKLGAQNGHPPEEHEA